MKKLLLVVAIVLIGIVAFVAIGNTIGHHLYVKYDEPELEKEFEGHIYTEKMPDGTTRRYGAKTISMEPVCEWIK